MKLRMINDVVAREAADAIIMKPKSRPWDIIQVFLPHNLSLSISGISTLFIKNIP